MKHDAGGSPRRPRPLIPAGVSRLARALLLLFACAASPPASAEEAGPASWDVDIVSFDTNFAPDGQPNLVVRYEIGIDRDHETEVFAEDCESPVEPAGLLSEPAITQAPSQDESSDDLTLGYTIDMGRLAESNVWDEEGNRLAVCQVVRLILPEQGFVITEDKRILQVTLNFDAQFGLTVEGEGGGLGGVVELPSDEEAGE